MLIWGLNYECLVVGVCAVLLHDGNVGFGVKYLR